MENRVYSEMPLEYCPVCGSDNLEIVEEDFEDILLTIQKECMDCYETWFEKWEFMANENEFGDLI
jgi:hypothetical protein